MIFIIAGFAFFLFLLQLAMRSLALTVILFVVGFHLFEVESLQPQRRVGTKFPSSEVSLRCSSSATLSGPLLKGEYGLFFDCDGVIVETEELHRMAYNKAFAFFGLRMPTDGSAVEWDVAYCECFSVSYRCSTSSLSRSPSLLTFECRRQASEHGGWRQAQDEVLLRPGEAGLAHPDQALSRPAAHCC